MHRAKPLSLSGLILGTYLLTRHVGSTFAFDKPVHTSIALLYSSAITTLACSRLLPKEGTRMSRGQQYDAVPLSDVGQPHASRESSPTPEDVRYPSSLRKLRICFFVLVLALCARAVVLHYTLTNIQCTVLSWEPLIPLLFAGYDYWTRERHRQVPSYDDPNASIYDEAIEGHLGRSPYRYIYAGILLAVGSIVGLSTASSAPSAFICASTLSNRWLVPIAQRVGTILDVMLLYCVTKLVEEQGSGSGLSVRIRSVGWGLLISATAMLSYGVLYTAFVANSVQRKRILEIAPVYLSSLTKLSAVACLAFLSLCFSVVHVGSTAVTFITTFVAICTITTTHAWNGVQAFPLAQMGLATFALCLSLAGFATYLCLDAGTHRNSHRAYRVFAERPPVWFWLTIATVLVVRTSLWASSSSSVSYHPIDLLIYDAQIAHASYANYTGNSRPSWRLSEAARTYRERYGRHPPPGFQHWHEYAIGLDSLVIENFDTIHRDLKPFWALAPDQIRNRTWQMMSNPWHDASGLSIRNGKVSVSESKFAMPTHAWMLEGLVKMIGNFAHWLPDMDLAFNVNDECRVAVPFDVIEGMRRSSEQATNDDRLAVRASNSFSADRDKGWTPLPEEPNTDRAMREMSWQKVFNEFGNSACSPNSAAKTQRNVNRGELCTSCIGPQSMGAFLANWTLANDVCHQPDMAFLHGIYVAPAAFKATHELYPIFSQSKVSGFNDILYPSAWNYIDKAKYDPKDEFPDPPFAEKTGSLFWRGATSEGFSSGNGQWKGMARQRFVHLANGVNGTGSNTHAILTPYDTASGEHKLSYQNVPVSLLTELLPTDVHVVKSIARCGGPDCPQQVHEFAPLVEPTDFQAHWGYKYLLDLDGAGFSGRFLPFLHSHSLPFKAAVFREWWDDRLTAWQHFVPLDIRGHGLWATLAYFAGLKGKINGKEVAMEPHDKEAERIAENGREWAGKVLRKEDMEIYMFRLLLEWGRLTDDRRDEIGYTEDLADG